MSRGDEEFEIKTESIAINEEWQMDLILPNVRNENEEINKSDLRNIETDNVSEEMLSMKMVPRAALLFLFSSAGT